MEESYGIAAFRSRQQVLMFEEALRREGVRARIVTTPREVALGCGLSARFELRDLDGVKRTLGRTSPGNLVGVYRVDHREGRARVTAIVIRP